MSQEYIITCWGCLPIRRHCHHYYCLTSQSSNKAQMKRQADSDRLFWWSFSLSFQSERSNIPYMQLVRQQPTHLMIIVTVKQENIVCRAFAVFYAAFFPFFDFMSCIMIFFVMFWILNTFAKLVNLFIKKSCPYSFSWYLKFSSLPTLLFCYQKVLTTG